MEVRARRVRAYPAPPRDLAQAQLRRQVAERVEAPDVDPEATLRGERGGVRPVGQRSAKRHDRLPAAERLAHPYLHLGRSRCALW